LTDDSSPEDIKEKLNLSKSSFKKAVGRLMKRNVIEMTRDGIRLADGSKKIENKNTQRPNRNLNNKYAKTPKRK